MRKKIMGLFLNIALILCCVFPLSACSVKSLTTEEIQLFNVVCGAVSDYKRDNPQSAIATALGSDSSISCRLDTQVQESLLVTDIKALSVDGPLSVTVTFKVKTSSGWTSSSYISISAMYTFRLTDASANAAATALVYCTTHMNTGEECENYTYSNKAAYSASEFASIIRKGNYGGAVGSAITYFNYTNNTTPYAGQISISGINYESVGGILSLAFQSQTSTDYIPATTGLSSFCQAGLDNLYSSKSIDSYAYTYNLQATDIIIQNFSQNVTQDSLGSSRVSATLDSTWVEENAEDHYHTYEGTIAGSTPISSALGQCQYTLYLRLANSSFSIPAVVFTVFGQQTVNGVSSWYIINNTSEAWSDTSGLNTNAAHATRILDDNDNRCPNGSNCTAFNTTN